MGFDVIYFPPIHPIGFTKRKGGTTPPRANPASPAAPMPSAVRRAATKQVEPTLGTMKDFEWLVKKVKAKGMEIALDFAINCSPDHPYVRDHPDWFYQRPTARSSTPKTRPSATRTSTRSTFHCDDWKALWEEMKSIILFWCGKGVRIFRVDNPHTKPVAFWGWLIEGVQAQYPDADVSVRGVHQAQDDEGARQGGLHPELLLLYLAQHTRRNSSNTSRN